MINSRSIADLDPHVAALCQKHIDACKAAGVSLLVISTYRDNEEQDWLYGQGRSRPGAVVTQAQAGGSWHNFKCAYDAVPLVHGSVVWDTRQAVWHTVWDTARHAGLQLGADWPSFKDMDHFQAVPTGMTLEQAKIKFNKHTTVW